MLPIMIAGTPCNKVSKLRAFVEAIKLNSQCKVFVLENVPELLTSKDEKLKYEILDALNEFEISYGILNSAGFGTPELREKSLFIGSKIGKIELPTPLLGVEEYYTVGESLKKVDSSWPNMTEMDLRKLDMESLKEIKHISQGEFVKGLPIHLTSDGKYSKSYKRLNENKPSHPLVRDNGPITIHPFEDRQLYISEISALSDMAKDFKFFGTLASKKRQLALGIPLNLAKAIAEQVKKAFKNFRLKEKDITLQLV